jgi:hypothetical protein
MSEDYFDIAWLCGETKAILHGQRADGTQVYRPLSEDERNRVMAMEAKHYAAMGNLLRELAA